MTQEISGDRRSGSCAPGSIFGKSKLAGEEGGGMAGQSLSPSLLGPYAFSTSFFYLTTAQRVENMEGHGHFSYIWSASRKRNVFIVLYNVLFTSRFVGSRSLCFQTRRLDLDNELYDANRKKINI